MLTPVSLRNLQDGGWQTVLSVAGISFAIILIFLQLGFLGAVLDTSVLFYDNLKFDLIARSPDYYHVCDAKNFPRETLFRIENVAGVKTVEPFHLSLVRWNNAEKSVQRGMLVMGVNAYGKSFSASGPRVEFPDMKILTDERFILVDEKSHPQFLGFDNSRHFSPADVGLQIELNEVSCIIIGTYKMGTGLAANGAAIINEQGYERLFPFYGHNRVAFGLIQLNETPVRNLEALRARIYQSLNTSGTSMPGVEILTRDEAIERERQHWIFDTPVGFIFLTGVMMSFLVGAIIVYIVLSADISRQFREYATLKAMGFRIGYLYRIVLEQALMLGLLSYIISYLIAIVLYRIIGDAANLPIDMSSSRQIVVFVSSILMCSLSSAIAMQKLRKADPADLF